ncbi:hypothetical protein BD779DRAFT_1473896 [Infundibulicybe gibba]|nr:hypothetical protein BD779DRAFT_1473896 [Infundibulicybe gibba]
MLSPLFGSRGGSTDADDVEMTGGNQSENAGSSGRSLRRGIPGQFTFTEDPRVINPPNRTPADAPASFPTNRPSVLSGPPPRRKVTSNTLRGREKPSFRPPASRQNPLPGASMERTIRARSPAPAASSKAGASTKKRTRDVKPESDDEADVRSFAAFVDAVLTHLFKLGKREGDVRIIDRGAITGVGKQLDERDPLLGGLQGALDQHKPAQERVIDADKVLQDKEVELAGLYRALNDATSSNTALEQQLAEVRTSGQAALDNVVDEKQALQQLHTDALNEWEMQLNGLQNTQKEALKQLAQKLEELKDALGDSKKDAEDNRMQLEQEKERAAQTIDNLRKERDDAVQRSKQQLDEALRRAEQKCDVSTQYSIDNQGDKQHCSEVVQQMQQERDDAVRSLGELTKERDDAISKAREQGEAIQHVEQERDDAIRALGDLEETLDDAAQEVVQERDSLRTERDNAFLRIDELNSTVSRAEKAGSEAVLAAENAGRLRADATRTLEKLTKERDDAISEANKQQEVIRRVERERDDAGKLSAGAACTQEKLTKERDNAISEANRQQEVIRRVEGERDGAASALADLRKERDKVTCLLNEERGNATRALADLQKKRDEAVRAAEEIEKLRIDAVHALGELREERDNALSRAKEREEDIQRITGERDDAIRASMDSREAQSDSAQTVMRERDEAIHALERLRKERDDAIRQVGEHSDVVQRAEEKSKTYKSLMDETLSELESLKDQQTKWDSAVDSQFTRLQEKMNEKAQESTKQAVQAEKSRLEEAASRKQEDLLRQIRERDEYIKLEKTSKERLEAEIAQMREGGNLPNRSMLNGDTGSTEQLITSTDHQPTISQERQGLMNVDNEDNDISESLVIRRMSMGKGKQKQLRFSGSVPPVDKHCTQPNREIVRPPMRFSRPFGCDSPMAKRLGWATARSETPQPQTSMPRNHYQEDVSTSDAVFGGQAAGPSKLNFFSIPPQHTSSSRYPRNHKLRAGAISDRTPPPYLSLGPRRVHNFGFSAQFPELVPKAYPPAISHSQQTNTSASAQPNISTSGFNLSPTHIPSTSNPDVQTILNPESILGDALKEITAELRSTREEFAQAIKTFSGASGGRVKSRPHGEFKLRRVTKPRSTLRSQMMTTVRTEFNKLLGISQDADIINVIKSVMASPEDLDDYNMGITTPTLQPLRLFWDTIHNPWNDSIAESFMAHIAQEHPELAGESSAVTEHFFQRLDSIRRNLHERLPRTEDETPERVAERVAARTQRTLTRLYQTRLRICREDKKQIWKVLADMVSSLGVDGQSSDESDGETHLVRFKEWRSAEILELLEFIDENRKTTNNYGNPIGGAQPHARIRPTYPPASAHQPVAGLPKNFYSRAWYDSLTDIQQKQLAASAPIELPSIM